MSSQTTSEQAFIKQAEAAREALLVFNSLRHLKAPGPIKNALTELVNSTVRQFHLFHL